MYVRVTRFANKPDKIDEAQALAQKLLPDIKSIPGLKVFINAQRDDGKGVTIALYSSKEAADAAHPKAKDLWSRFGDLWLTPPDSEDYKVRMLEVIG